MSALNSLPNECLLLIYKSLGDFDEVDSLAQCCLRFRRLLQSNYLRIWRSVITRSATYSYDIRLSQFISEVQEYSSQYANGFEPPAHGRPSGQTFRRCYFATSKNLTDAHVLSIVDRWRRVRRLQNLYLEACVPRIPRIAVLRHENYRFSLHGEDGLDPISNFFNYRQTRRFYKASMAYWLAIEARRLAHVSNYRNLEEESLVHELLERLWIDGDERTLLETMDVLEVYIFLYEFLAGKLLLDDESPRSWSSGERFCLEWGWDSFVSSCRLYIHPLQIADLTPGRGGPKHKPSSYNKIEFAGLCGVFDRQGVVLDGSTNNIRDDRFSICELERDVELKMRAMETGDYHQGYANIWACYRKHWDGHASAVFWWAASSQDVIRQIDHYAREADCLKIHPDFTHLSRRFG